MIGGLVQHQQVGAGEQQARQQGARALPAGKLGQRAAVIVFVEAQAGQRLADAGFVGVAAGQLEGFLQAPVAVQDLFGLLGVAHGVFQAGQLGFLLEQVG